MRVIAYFSLVTWLVVVLIWAQVPSTKIEVEVQHAIKTEQMSNDIKTLQESFGRVQAMQLEVRLSRMEDTLKRNEDRAVRQGMMMSALLVGFVGFLLQYGIKYLMEKKTPLSGRRK